MRIGSLFTGYGGLDLAAEAVTGARTIWTSDYDPNVPAAKHGPNIVIRERFPDAPNLGDISRIDWSAVDPVDIITAGFPCQDVSAAGRRAGLKPGTRTGLWTHVVDAVDQLRPRYLIAENVRGLLNADAHSNVEPCPVCMGNGPASHLRALGAVLGDLADIGYDAWWCGLRAADVGAPHGRFRIFIVATDPGQSRRGRRPDENVRQGRGNATERDRSTTDPERGRRDRGTTQRRRTSEDTTGGSPATADTGCLHRDEGRPDRPGETTTSGPRGQLGRRDSTPADLLPTPDATHGRKTTRTGPLLAGAVDLLPTPRATDGSNGGPNQRGSAGDLMLPSAVNRLLPTPTTVDSRAGRNATANRRPGATFHDGWTLSDVAYADRFGQYAEAIARWDAVTGQTAPDPTDERGRLDPAFVEWMMGLPTGWVTNLALTRTQKLRLLGNGVVPQQAATAIEYLMRKVPRTT